MAAVVDVREVPVLCAAGMEVLVAAHAQLAEYGCAVRVTGTRPLAVRCVHVLALQDLLTKPHPGSGQAPLHCGVAPAGRPTAGR